MNYFRSRGPAKWLFPYNFGNKGEIETGEELIDEKPIVIRGIIQYSCSGEFGERGLDEYRRRR
jgi:hypothetical protein